MRKLKFLRLLLLIGFLSIVCAFLLGHFTPISENLKSFLKGTGITLIVAYFLKASVTKTV
ncbi:MAG: hypothetical protein EOP42_17045 [Sphingobacteriaceae bacterium]|nr:MAG: hypothetical protein EOP42_17045 [Sphingobacteriaceae bacterium]